MAMDNIEAQQIRRKYIRLWFFSIVIFSVIILFIHIIYIHSNNNLTKLSKDSFVDYVYMREMTPTYPPPLYNFMD
jgi:hypothetical protein